MKPFKEVNMNFNHNPTSMKKLYQFSLKVNVNFVKMILLKKKISEQTYLFTSWIKEPQKCELCGQSFIEKKRFKKHIVKGHEKQKPFEYEFCKYMCSVKSSLKKHIYSVHYNKKPFKCEMCDKSLPKWIP